MEFGLDIIDNDRKSDLAQKVGLEAARVQFQSNDETLLR